jgi:hypothetical protein
MSFAATTPRRVLLETRASRSPTHRSTSGVVKQPTRAALSIEEDRVAGGVTKPR